MTQVSMITLVFALAWLVEAATEYLLGYLTEIVPWLKPVKPFLPYAALAVAEFTAFYYQVDLLTLIPGVVITPVGVAFTGFLVSRGAGLVNDFISFIQGKMGEG